MRRRSLIASGLVAAGAATAARAADGGPPLELVLTLRVEIGPGIEAGEVGGGRKRIVPITGGSFSGKASGKILPGGADWQIIRPSGVTEIWARYTLQPSDDTAAIIVTNPGIRRASPEIAAKLAAGERVDPALYYFRASPQFETGSAKHRWLMESTFVCVGERYPDHVAMKIYGVG